MLNLYQPDPGGNVPRPDEEFHLQKGEPVSRTVTFAFGLGFVRIWHNLSLADGRMGKFRSWWLFGQRVHWYKGNVKCDGSRTYMYWNGQLDDGMPPKYIPDPTLYVMTTTPKEKLAVRFNQTPGEVSWNNMGGC